MIYNIVIRFGGIYIYIYLKVLEHGKLRKIHNMEIKKIICLLTMNF